MAMYLKAAGGNWTAAATWSATSAAGADSVGPPLAATDCIAELASGNVTIDSGAVCRSFDCTSGVGTYNGTITHNAITWTIGDGTVGAGNVALKLRCATYTLNSTSSAISFISTSGTQQAIDLGSKTSGNLTVSGAGSNYQLQSDVTGTSGATWTYSASATFDTNSHTITLTTSATRTFAGGGATYFAVVLSITSTSASFTITGANTFTSLTCTGPSGKLATLSLSANQTVTGTNMPTFTGNSATNRLLVTSDTRGTQRTITNTSTTPAITNSDFEDVRFNSAVDLSAVSGKSGDCGGNSGITFTTNGTFYATSNANYNESTTAIWFNGTGGSGGAGRVPLPQDTGIFEMTAGSKTITLDMPRHGALSFASIANTPALTNNTTATFYGSLTLDAGLGTYSGTATLTFSTRGSISITSAGKTFTNSFVSDAPGGTVTLADSFIQTGTSGWVHTQGTHAVSNVSATYVSYSSNNSNTRTVTQGSVTPTITGNALTIWSCATLTNCTFTTRPAITCNYSGATGTRTFNHGSTAGGTEANALSVTVTAGTDTVALNGGLFFNVNLTGFTGTRSANNFTSYGNLTAGTGMTWSSSLVTFAATSGTQTFTSNSVNIDGPITINAPGATVQLADALAMGTATSRALTLTAGTLDLNGKTLTLFGTVTIGAGSGTRQITWASGTIDITLNTATTVVTYTGTNFTNSGTGTLKLSASTTNARSIQQGGATWSNLLISNATAAGQVNLLGNGTWSDITWADTNGQTLKIETAKTVTITTWGVSAASGSEIVINSCTSAGAASTGTHSLVKSGGGTITANLLNIQHSVATPTLTWLATNSTNNQATATAGSGWYFGAFNNPKGLFAIVAAAS